MEDYRFWIMFAIVVIAIVAFVIYFVVKIGRMKPDEREKLIITYLKGAIALAEQEIGSGHGKEKLEEVEEYFDKHAPWLIRILLMFSGEENLEDFIETALKEVKEAFGEKKEK